MQLFITDSDCRACVSPRPAGTGSRRIPLHSRSIDSGNVWIYRGVSRSFNRSCGEFCHDQRPLTLPESCTHGISDRVDGDKKTHAGTLLRCSTIVRSIPAVHPTLIHGIPDRLAGIRRGQIACLARWVQVATRILAGTAKLAAVSAPT